jgi:hypothetical protein
LMLNGISLHWLVWPYDQDHGRYHRGIVWFGYLMRFDGIARCLLVIRSPAGFFGRRTSSLWRLSSRLHLRFRRTKFWRISLIGSFLRSSRCRNIMITISYVRHSRYDLITKWIAFFIKVRRISLSMQFRILSRRVEDEEYQLGL